MALEPFIRKGEQVWNDDHTEGYEFTEDIEPMTPCMAHQFKPLGESKAVVAGELMPQWLYDIILVPGGYMRYKSRQ